MLCLLAGCATTGSGDDDPADPDAEAGDEAQAQVRFNPNVRVGEIIWINDRADFVVTRLDRKIDSFEPTFLLALDPRGDDVTGFLVGGGRVEGRSFGARVLEGEVAEGGEIRVPGPEWTEYLYKRYQGRDFMQQMR